MRLLTKEKQAMTTTTSTPILESQDADIQAVTPASTVLWRRLGLEALPDHQTMFIPTERLIVVGADHLMRSAKRLVKSIQHVGILQPPSVVVQAGVDVHDPEATFEVIAGRRRVLAARLAGLPVIKCEVYAASTLPLSALLALIENEQRSAAWVREVEALRCLIDEGVGMTLDDLTAFGFDHATLSERLKIAQLPAALLTRVLAGSVSREVARKLVRLTNAQQERVARLAEVGEEITVDKVNQVLRAQINAGLAPIQAALAQGWEDQAAATPTLETARSSQPFLTSSDGEEQAGQSACAPGKEAAQDICPSNAITSMTALLAAVQAFTHRSEYWMAPKVVQTLTQALQQQLRLALWEARSSSQSDSTVQTQN
jgi:ParB/RepB/Spo0J family partition protein